MYTDFAQVYDRLMDDVPYEKWARFYRDILEKAGCAGRDMAECGCGTGSLSVPLAKMGMRVVAGDISEEMLMQAAEKARRAGVAVRFNRQDMRAFRLTRPVDAVVCGCDGVNYLLQNEDASAFFASAHRALKAGGVLSFDVSTRCKLTRMVREGMYGEDRDDVTYMWINTPGEAEDTVHMELAFFLREKDGRYCRFDEEQTQRIYDMDTLDALLTGAGFGDVRFYGDLSENEPTPLDKRIFITARKV